MRLSVIKLFFAIAIVQVLSLAASEACTSPTGVAGSTAYFSSALHFCNGTTWRALTFEDTGAPCAVGAGRVTLDSGNIRVCNGTNWIRMNSSVTDGTCSTNGRMQYDSGNTRMEYCNGTNWLVMGDPCVGTPPVGTVCAGGALYAGTYSSGKYMIMPGGCADSTSNPTCSGVDSNLTTQKTFNDGTTSFYDIPTVQNVASANAASTQLGSAATPFIAAITNPAEGGAHVGARHCNDMTFGGHSDWSLPSKSELAYLYCLSTPDSHNVSYPQENVNCGGSGPTNQLPSFTTATNDVYMTTTESNSALGRWVWQISMRTGQTTISKVKNDTYLVRCIRRY
jgi:hypothetical protein